MHPLLFRIPGLGLPIYAYGFMVMAGFLVATMLGRRQARTWGIPDQDILDLAVWMVVAGIAGARILHWIEFHREYDWSLFRVWDGGVNWIGVAAGLALPGLWIWLRRKPGARPWTRGDGVRLVAVSLATAAIAGRVVFVALAGERFKDPWGLFAVWRGGLIFYGGLLLAVATGIWFLRRRGHSVLRLGDFCMPWVALGYGIARLGCFFNGCCWGREWDGPWAVRFPSYDAETAAIVGRKAAPALLHQIERGLLRPGAEWSLPVHPTQLYLVAGGLLMWGLLLWAQRRSRGRGFVLFLYPLIYGLVRFTVESLRSDNERYGGLTLSQWLSVGLVVVGAVGVIALRKSNTPTPEALTSANSGEEKSTVDLNLNPLTGTWERGADSEEEKRTRPQAP